MASSPTFDGLATDESVAVTRVVLGPPDLIRRAWESHRFPRFQVEFVFRATFSVRIRDAKGRHLGEIFRVSRAKHRLRISRRGSPSQTHPILHKILKMTHFGVFDRGQSGPIAQSEPRKGYLVFAVRGAYGSDEDDTDKD